ncbi:MAG: hypothetical protein AAF733_08920 [Verrucomicrobiota bacterium]
MFRYVLLILSLTVFLPLQAQEAELHTFTDKSGQQVSASLLSVSSDMRKMKIRREDGQEFDLVINVLSLDDQQFVKERLETVPIEKTEYRVDMEIDRKSVDSETYPYRDGESDYSLTRESVIYEVTVRNLSRETIEAATLEWAVAIDDRMDLVETEEGWNMDRQARDEEENPAVLAGETAISSLPFNQDTVVTTGEVEISRMLYNRDPYEEDIMKGAIARLVGLDGDVIVEARLGGSEIDEMEWEDAIALLAPAEEE